MKFTGELSVKAPRAAVYDKLRDARFCAYDAGGRSVLLVFRWGATLETVRLPGGTIPPHDGHGPLHVAFAIDAADLATWE